MLSFEKFSKPGIVQIILALLALIGLLTLPLYASRYAIVLLGNIFMYVVITVSWTIFSGPTRYISLASAAFFGIGVYTAAGLGMVLPLPAIIMIGALLSFCVAVFVGGLTLRLRGIYFAMFTLGLVELIVTFLRWWEVHYSGTVGRLVVSVDNTTVYYIMLLILVLAILTAHLIARSKFGLALQSIGECEEAATHIGINATLLKVVTFAISAFFMGATGVIMATRWTYVDPRIAFDLQLSFMPMVMAIIGGMNQLYGPILGAVFFTYLEEILITRFPYYYMLIFGFILVVAIMYLPKGVGGLVQKLWAKRSGGKNAHTSS
ncbi:MAG: branched-chain amino acid ABC transporter permease [Desulfotomaculaceae bacterium]